MKSDQLTIRQRVEEIYQIRLRGALWADIRQHASDKGWGVSDRQLRRYVEQSDELIAEAAEPDRRKLLNRAVAQREVVYAHCMAVADYSTARAVLADRDKLLGLYPAERHEHTGKDGAPMELVVKRIGGGASMEDP
jgi:hypothetical protein